MWLQEALCVRNILLKLQNVNSNRWVEVVINNIIIILYHDKLDEFSFANELNNCWYTGKASVSSCIDWSLHLVDL